MKIVRICKTCKNEFKTQECWLKKSNSAGSYCSQKCRHILRNIELKCSQCEKVFMTHLSKKFRKFCSVSCSNIKRAEKLDNVSKII
jgi:endogenous inhibitor of DNA gyrase (YacG/DUF329 family)